MEKNSKVFISCTERDAGYAQHLIEALERYKLEINLNINEFPKSIEQYAHYLLSSRVVVFFLGEHYVSSFKGELEFKSLIAQGTIDASNLVWIRTDRNQEIPSQQHIGYLLPKKGGSVSESTNLKSIFAEIAEDVCNLFNVLGNSKAVEVLKIASIEESTNLNLSDCKLEEVPLPIYFMPRLKSINLSGNRIRRISNLESLNTLQTLDLSDNAISKIENISRLYRLEFLDLSRNNLVVADNLGSFPNLKFLGLNSNNIKFVFLSQNLKSLTKLHLSGNRLEQIPRLPLPKLEILALNDNNVVSLDNLEFYSFLKIIDLSGNQIESIRPLLPYLKHGLEIAIEGRVYSEGTIILSNNPLLREPSIETVTQGKDAVIKYFDDLESYGDVDLNVIKVVLVGNSEVGKSDFSEFIRTEKIIRKAKSTDLLDIILSTSKPIGHNNILVNIFDFGGQDFYHDSHRLFYSQDTAYVLIWDRLSNRFGEVVDKGIAYDNFPLEYWLESINYKLMSHQQIDELDAQKRKNMLMENPIWILQNKIDLVDSNQGTDDSIVLSSKFLDQSVLSYRYPNIWDYTSVALRAGLRTVGLKEIFETFIKSHPSAGRKLISFQYDIIQYFLDGKQDFSILNLEDFKHLCETLIKARKVNFNGDDAVVIAGILNNMGLILYDRNEEQIFTDVLCLNDIIKDIILAARLKVKHGVFKFSAVSHIAHANEVLSLLCRNHSIIDIGSDNYLAPQLLVRKREDSFGYLKKAFGFFQVRFAYKAYFHKSLLLSIFAKYLGKEYSVGKSMEQMQYGYDYILISTDADPSSQMVLIEFEKELSMGFINIRTIHPFQKANFEGSVVETISELNLGWSVEKELSVDSRHFISVSELSKGLALYQYVFHMDGGPHKISAFKDLHQFENLPKKVFISYSSKNTAFAKRLMTHLEVLRSLNYIEPWFDRMIESGARWNDEIKKEMLRADVVIFLMSPDFLATPYVMDVEVPMAIDLVGDNQSKLFFVELKDCGWRDTVLRQFQQTDNPQQDSKESIIIDNPENDKAWVKVIAELKAKLDIKIV